MKKHLFLIGFMGAGKTTIARRLSALTGIPHIDSDLYIERMAGTSIGSIFEGQGEQKFRALENTCLHTIVTSRTPIIVSTGGGMPCHDGNIELMLRSGLVIYIQLSAQKLSLRLQHETPVRPLLSNPSGPSLFSRISSLLEAREACYEQAHITIDANNLSAAQLSARILPYLA